MHRHSKMAIYFVSLSLLTILLVGGVLWLLAWPPPTAASPVLPDSSGRSTTPITSYVTATASASPTPTGCLAWRLMDSPSPGQYANQLADVEVLAPDNVWAVGSWSPTSSDQRTLILHWDGTQWSHVLSPNPGQRNNLVAIDAVSPNDIWAVGGYTAYHRYLLALHWDGQSWTEVPTPAILSSDIADVAVVSANDIWAVGIKGSANRGLEPFSIHWDGQSWTEVPTPSFSINYDYFTGVSALASNDVWAVGFYDNTTTQKDTPILLHWNGQQWNSMPAPEQGNLDFNTWSIKAIAPDDVWVVGWRNPEARTLVLHWDGQSWSVVPSPNPHSQINYLWGVDGTSPNDVWAVGEYGGRALTMHWNGQTWTAINSANYSPGQNILYGVDAYSSTEIWAAGACDFCLGQSNSRTLVERYSYGSGSCPTLTPTPTASTTPTSIATSTPTSMVTSTPTQTGTSIAGTPSHSPTTVLTSTHTSTATATATATATIPVTTVTTVTTVWPSPTSILPSSSPTSARTLTATVAVTTATVTPAPTTCAIQFTDVIEGSTFYTFIRCLACRSIVSGYSDGTFRPNNEVTRGQLSKMVSNAAGFAEDPGTQIFEDVAPDSTFYSFINRLTRRGVMTGYQCGGPGEPCLNGNRPYFRPGNPATRGQTSKIVANAAGYNEEPTTQTFEDVPTNYVFYKSIEVLSRRSIIGGYQCGGPGEPCLNGSRPYFRPSNNVTRGQSAKIAANTFYPDCDTPASR